MTAADAALLLQARLLAMAAQGAEPDRLAVEVVPGWWLDLDLSKGSPLPAWCRLDLIQGHPEDGAAATRGSVVAAAEPSLAVLAYMARRLGQRRLVRRLRRVGDLPPDFLA